MNEYEIVDLFLEAVSGTWALIQIWMGVAFGYIAVAHFYGKALNLVQVAVLSLVFLTFSLALFSLSSINLAALDGYELHLRQIGESESLSPGTIDMLEQRAKIHAMFRWPLVLCVLTLFVSALVYLPFCYWKSGRGGT